MTWNRYLIIFAVSLPLAGLGSACKRAGATSSAKESLPPQLVEVVTLQDREVQPTIESIGKAKPHRDLLVSVEMSGKLVTLPYNVGDTVTRGKLLARVRTLGLWSQRSAAKANVKLVNTSLAQSEKDLKDVESLYKKGVVSKNNYDLAKLKVDTERAQLRSARASLGQISETIGGTSVVAPFDGEVAARNSEEGSFVMTGSPLLRIVDLSRVKVTVGLTELDVSTFKAGDHVTVTAIAWPQKTWKGTIFSISPSVDARSGLFPVEVSIDNTRVPASTKARWMLREGMTMKVTFPRPKVRGFFVPAQAVVERNGKKCVWITTGLPKGERRIVAVPGGAKEPVAGVKLVPVTLGKRYEGWFQVLDGVAAGEKAVTTGVSKLRKDSVVRTRSVKGIWLAAAGL